MTLKLYEYKNNFIHSMSRNENLHKYLIEVLGFQYVVETHHAKPIVRHSIALRKWCFDMGTSYNELNLCILTGEIPQCIKNPRVGFIDLFQEFVNKELHDFAVEISRTQVADMEQTIKNRSAFIIDEMKKKGFVPFV